MSKRLVLVTGVTGFIAGHVADQLLTAGYRVRGLVPVISVEEAANERSRTSTARGAKVKQLTETVNRPGMEFVQVDDLIDSDLTEALEGVDAIIHVASPLPGKASVQHTLDTAKEGTLHVLREAVKAKVEKIVVTSTFGNLMNPDLGLSFAGKTITSKDWGHVTPEEAKEPSRSPPYVYFASKLLAERALWDFVKDHPQLDVVTILPGYVFGPYAETFPHPITKESIGTNNMILAIMNGPLFQPSPYIVDVRDVAKAHILALDLPRNPGALERRYIVNGGNLSWREAVDHLKITHPELNNPPSSEYPELPGPVSTLDTSNTIADLNFGKFREPKQVIDDTVAALQEIRKAWA
ncbi:NAD(P)-binding protein [Tricholoma matsutake]|nr:NAD(P)-binding protein [Tricholoma matsutake 945]